MAPISLVVATGMILSILTQVFYIACIILGVAYLTLFERKVLSLPQYRVGPSGMVLVLGRIRSHHLLVASIVHSGINSV